MAVATSFATPNFSGLLFAKGQQATPLSTMIGAKPLYTNHVEFTCGQEFATEQGSQPAISENASLTAPTPAVVTRSQKVNVTQIFMESVSISYAKQSNMGTLSGINVAAQQANPMDELAFQVTRRMAKIAQDIEYTFMNGVYNKATTDDEVNKSRGLLTAITSNILDMDGKPLTYWKVAEGLKSIHEQGARTDSIVLGVDATTLLQLNLDAQKNNLTIVPLGREINGIKIQTVVTPLGIVGVSLMDTLPAGTAVLFNPDVMAPVYQPVPGKGNFFLEQIAKKGAGETYQIFGQVGLDHGPEWMAAKFTNIAKQLPSSLTPSTPIIGSLTVTSAAGTNAGDTTITVTPAKSASNSYMYKIGDGAVSVVYGDDVSAWTAWNGSADITAANGKTITVVEADTNGKAVKAGSAVVTANTGA